MSDVNVDKADASQGQPAPGEGEETAVVDQQVASFAELAEQGHTATKLDVTAPPVLEVENLKMYFPVKSSGVVRRTIGHVQAVDGISFQVPKGGSLGLVGPPAVHRHHLVLDVQRERANEPPTELAHREAVPHREGTGADEALPAWS